MTDTPTDWPTVRPSTPDRSAATDGRTAAPPVANPPDGGDRLRADRSPDGANPRWLAVALPVAIWTLTVVVTFLALSGQVEFAQWAGITDWRRYLVPAGLELSAVGFLLVGYRRALAGYSPAGMWAVAGLVGGFAVWTNVVHAGERAGPVFGAFTVVALLLWFVKFRDDYAKHQRRTGQATKPSPRFGRLWLFAPRLTSRAAMIATRLQLTEVKPATVYAELWRAVNSDAKAAGIPRRLRKRTAWQTVMAAAGHPVADLPTVAEVATVSIIDRPTPTAVEPEPESDAGQSTSEPTDQSLSSVPDRSLRASRRPRGRKSTGKPTGRLRVVSSAAAVANAGILRSRYGKDLPTAWQIRKDLGWSYDRVEPAIRAYNTGADREQSTNGPTDRSESDKDKEPEAVAFA